MGGACRAPLTSFVFRRAYSTGSCFFGGPSLSPDALPAKKSGELCYAREARCISRASLLSQIRLRGDRVGVSAEFSAQ